MPITSPNSPASSAQHVASLELTTDDDIAIRIDAVNLEDRLCDV